MAVQMADQPVLTTAEQRVAPSVGLTAERWAVKMVAHLVVPWAALSADPPAVETVEQTVDM